MSSGNGIDENAATESLSPTASGCNVSIISVAFSACCMHVRAIKCP